MITERYKELESNQDLRLTPQEILDGWCFCCEWDGLLINSNDKDGEGGACTCELSAIDKLYLICKRDKRNFLLTIGSDYTFKEQIEEAAK